MLEVTQEKLIMVFSMVFHEVSILLEVIIPEELQAVNTLIVSLNIQPFLIVSLILLFQESIKLEVFWEGHIERSVIFRIADMLEASQEHQMSVESVDIQIVLVVCKV